MDTENTYDTPSNTRSSSRWMRYVPEGLIWCVTLLAIFPPPFPLFTSLSPYTLWLMAGWLMLGLVCFVFHQQRLMMASMLCCIVLCLHLKESTNKQLRLPASRSSPAITVAHINLGNAESDYASVTDYLLTLPSDFLSVQELTPDWDEFLSEKLAARYPHIHTMTRLDQYGIGLFSKIPLFKIDTIEFRGVPALAATIQLQGNIPCQLVSCQMVPPVNQAAYATIAQHFKNISGYLKKEDGQKLVIGDFHLPPWSTEVTQFRSESTLMDGRRDVHTRNLDGSMSLPRIPVEHILFSDGLECTSFSEVGNGVVGRLGITGNYQVVEVNGE